MCVKMDDNNNNDNNHNNNNDNNNKSQEERDVCKDDRTHFPGHPNTKKKRGTWSQTRAW